MSDLFHQNLSAECLHVILGENPGLLGLNGCSRDLSHDWYHIGICIPLRVFIVLLSFFFTDRHRWTEDDPSRAKVQDWHSIGEITSAAEAER